MNSKIKVRIYGIKEQCLSLGCGCSDGGCGNRKNFCSGCSSRCGNSSRKCCLSSSAKALKTVGEAYQELEEFIKNSDVANNTELEFIDIYNNSIKDNNYTKVKKIINKRFEPPITVIDGIIRYYGGISNTLIYKDIKELLE